MNMIKCGIYSVMRKPIKSLLLLLVVITISIFFTAALASHSASIQTQDSTRQAVGATFRMEINEPNRQKRLDEAMKVIGEQNDGSYGGVIFKRYPDGSSYVGTDNFFDTIKVEDVEKIASVSGVEDYNLITMSTVVNPVNFKRIEDPDVDQNRDLGGVNVRGNRNMEMDMDVSSGKIELLNGRMIMPEDRDVCVISRELADLNGLKVGNKLKVNNIKDPNNSQIYSAEIIGIYKATQNMTSIMSGDSYRPENTIFTDLGFPEKPSGEEGNPLYQYAIFKVRNVDLYDDIKKEIKQIKINWERYDLIDNNGNIENMAKNFNDMAKISKILFLLVMVAGFIILVFIFLFWIKNRVHEIGILMALGKSKLNILFQFLWEAILISIVGIVISFSFAPALSETLASSLAQQSQQMNGTTVAENVATDWVAPELTVEHTSVQITEEMVIKDIIAVIGLVTISVSFAGISIMRKKPKEILSEMS